MRHRCSPWNHIPYQRGGWEGWEVVRDTAELLDKRLNATFHFDRTLLLINMRTPAGVLEQSPENSGHPGDVSLLWAPGLFFPNSPFISIYFERLVKKSCDTVKTSMTCSLITGIIGGGGFVCSSSSALIISFRLGFQTYANERGKAGALQRRDWFQRLIVNELIFGFCLLKTEKWRNGLEGSFEKIG